VRLQIPRKLSSLLKPARYKAAHGGRGSAKSHFFAQLGVATNHSAPKRGVCIREVQNSLKDSSYQLVIDKIAAMGLDGHFKATRDEIKGANGSLMIFKGMQAYNAENIKSLEGFDWAWIDEAQTLSARSWRMLRPTIRRENSEIWSSWNPRNDTDPVDAFFRGAHRPANATVVEINWRDNPWFPNVLREEMERDYVADPEMAEHVWGGGYEIISDGAYYARWVAAAEREGRVGHFPYDPAKRLRTAWDLGVDDYMAVWFIQDDGQIPTVVDFYECNGVGFDHVVATALPEVFIPPDNSADYVGWQATRALEEFGRDQPFVYSDHFLPHDIRVREMGSGARHRWEILAALGVHPINKGVPADPDERIAAGRRLLPTMRFNATPRVLHGLKRLRHYKRKRNETMGTWEGPAKDGNDHAADAFGEYALNSELLPTVVQIKVDPLAELLRPRTVDEVVAEQLGEMP
jgi:phage terminase large subunit